MTAKSDTTGRCAATCGALGPVGCSSGAGNSASNQDASVKKIFIPRDYSEGTTVKFQTQFHPDLEGLVERQHFEYLISTLNEMYYQAETSRAAYLESCFACLSAYLLYLCIETHYSKCMKKVAAFINDQNETVWKPRGLYVTDPIERGLRVIEIIIKVDETTRGNLSFYFF